MSTSFVGRTSYGLLGSSNVASTGSEPPLAGGGGVKSCYGFSLGTGLAGGHQSQIGLGLGSGAVGSRIGSGMQAIGGSIGLGLVSGGGGGGGGRFGMGWAAGGGGGAGFGGIGAGFGGIGAGFGGGGGAGFGGTGAGFGGGGGAGFGGTGAGFGGAGSGFGGAGSGFGAGFGAGGGSIAVGCPFVTNEKWELQTLNDRLASYLNKVKNLETANHELEEKLLGFKANKVQASYDLQAYQSQIQPLRDQLADYLKDCAGFAVLIDNIKLAADNFRIKYEYELAVRQTVEADVAALKALKREFEKSITALTQEQKFLLKDRECLQSTHQQEVMSLRGQMAGTLTIDVQADDSIDLSRRLADLRSEYEAIVLRNRREIENWYTGKLALKDKQTVQVTELTFTQNTEITASQDQILILQAELDALLFKNNYEEQRLVDIQGQKQMQLVTLSRLAGGLEGELASVRESALQQSRDYQALLSTKVQLEREIATYKALLEGAADFNKIAVIGRPSTSQRRAQVSEVITTISSVSVKGGAGDVAGTGGSMVAQSSSGSFTREDSTSLLEGAADLNKIADIGLPSTSQRSAQVSEVITTVSSVSVEGISGDVAGTEGSVVTQSSSGSFTREDSTSLLEKAAELNTTADISLPSTLQRSAQVSEVITTVSSVSVEEAAGDVIAETKSSIEAQSSSESFTGEGAAGVVVGSEGSTEVQLSSGSFTGEGAAEDVAVTEGATEVQLSSVISITEQGAAGDVVAGTKSSIEAQLSPGSFTGEGAAGDVAGTVGLSEVQSLSGGNTSAGAAGGVVVTESSIEASSGISAGEGAAGDVAGTAGLSEVQSLSGSSTWAGAAGDVAGIEGSIEAQSSSGSFTEQGAAGGTGGSTEAQLLSGSSTWAEAAGDVIAVSKSSIEVQSSSESFTGEGAAGDVAGTEGSTEVHSLSGSSAWAGGKGVHGVDFVKARSSISSAYDAFLE